MMRFLSFENANRDKKPTWRRIFPVVLALMTIPLFPGAARLISFVKVPRGRPNIIIIVMDTVRQSATSLAGKKVAATPFLSKLAEHAAVFENAFSTFDSTPESHYSIFTGFKRGFMSHQWDNPTFGLPYQLDQLGYDSVGISANFNVRKASMRSVTPFKVFLSPVNHYLSRLPKSLQQQLDTDAAEIPRYYDAPATRFNQNLIRGSAKAVNGLLDIALETIRQPALVFANFMDAHDPYFPPPEFSNREKEAPLPDFRSDLRKRPLPRWMTHPEDIPDEKARKAFKRRLETVRNRVWNLSDDLDTKALDRYAQRYHQEVAFLESQLKHCFDILQRHRLLDNAFVVITADHGESFGEKGYLTHSMENKGDKETSRHVPLMMVPTFRPAMTPVRITSAVSIADIAPTVYALLGIDDTPIKRQRPNQYGKSLYRYLSPAALATPKHPVTVDDAVPVDDESEKALFESLKALGYISDE